MPADTGPADRPAAVLWDMDGTLVDSERLWDVSLADTARWLGGELRPEVRSALVGADMAHTLQVLLDDLGVPPEPARIAATQAYIEEHTAELFRGGLPWRPGAPEALRTVRAAGIPMALVTNTERGLAELALDSIGREHFTVTVCGDEVPRGKPAPDPYLRAAELLGVPAARCVAVEDSPAGALAAERAGAAVLVVPSEVPVPGGARRTHRASLVGLRVGELAAMVPGDRDGRVA